MHSPKEIIAYLTRFIAGQEKAIADVSVACYEHELISAMPRAQREKIRVNNIMLAGGTGTGKTEIARRLAEILGRPLVIVPMTRFSETGYVGRDVMEIPEMALREAVHHVRKSRGTGRKIHEAIRSRIGAPEGVNLESISLTVFSHMDVSINAIPMDTVEQMMISANQNPESVREIVEAAEGAVVFLDEIDKLIEGDRGGAMVSRTGVQRELLSLVEGMSYYHPSYGKVNTHGMLFIAAGAFSQGSSPDMLMPELVGRFAKRAYLEPFSGPEAYEAILRKENSIIRQREMIYKNALPDFRFDDSAIKSIARNAHAINAKVEDGSRETVNVGARVLDRIVQTIMSAYILGEMTGPVSEFLVEKVMEEERKKFTARKKVGF